MSEQQTQRRLARLANLAALMGRYSHRWSREPSRRLLAWVDEYNDLRVLDERAWAAHCRRHGFDPRHSAYDLFS